MKLIDKVKSTPSILADFATPPYKVQVEAIKADPTVIRYIRNPNPKIQTLAVQRGGWAAYNLIENPCRQAQVALVQRRPADVRKLPYDEDLIAQAIRIHPEVVMRYKTLPYWLQKLAIETSKKKTDVMFLIKNPHPTLLKEYLAENPNLFSAFDQLPLEVELDLINACPDINSMVYKFSGFRNPSIAIQNHYVRAILAQATRANRIIDTYWWKNVSNKIDDELKFRIIELVNWASMTGTVGQQLKKLVTGSPELESALTLML